MHVCHPHFDGISRRSPGRYSEPRPLPTVDYQAFANVTSQVAAAGNGTYTCANVQASVGTNVYAGWALVVAYEAPGLPARNLTVFDGYASINTGQAPVTGSINGFVTPPDRRRQRQGGRSGL